MAKSWSRMGMGWWWIFERGRASGEGAGRGARVWGGGGREFEFGLFGFGMRFLNEISERFWRAPRAGLASFSTHLCAALVHRDAFPRGVGVIFDAPLRGIGTPGSVFSTKFRSVF